MEERYPNTMITWAERRHETERRERERVWLNEVTQIDAIAAVHRDRIRDIAVPHHRTA